MLCNVTFHFNVKETSPPQGVFLIRLLESGHIDSLPRYSARSKHNNYASKLAQVMWRLSVTSTLKLLVQKFVLFWSGKLHLWSQPISILVWFKKNYHTDPVCLVVLTVLWLDLMYAIHRGSVSHCLYCLTGNYISQRTWPFPRKPSLLLYLESGIQTPTTRLSVRQGLILLWSCSFAFCSLFHQQCTWTWMR